MVAVALATVMSIDRWESRDERRRIQAPSVGDGVESMLSPPNIDPFSLIFPPARHVIFASRVHGSKKFQICQYSDSEDIRATRATARPARHKERPVLFDELVCEGVQRPPETRHRKHHLGRVLR
jgi:hypothetical protein